MQNARTPLNSAIDEILHFHESFLGQSSLARLQTQLTTKKRLLGPIMLLVGVLSKIRLGTMMLLWGMIWFYPKACFSGGTATPSYIVSLTQNNTRALQRVLPFIAPTASLNNKKPSKRYRWQAMLKCWKIARDVTQHLKQNGNERSLVRTQQLFSVASILLFEQDWKAAQPHVVITANDHSAPTVALYALAKATGVRSCYVQHGSVTNSFPPLKYDLSVLYNAHSFDLYCQSAQRQDLPLPDRSSVCFYPENSTPLLPLRFPNTPIDICIALSFFLEQEALQDLMIALRENPNIGTVYLSQHPRCTHDLGLLFAGSDIKLLPRNQRAHNLSTVVDLCLVSNSGVTLEFLHAGIPTLYWAGGDQSPEDYYGFLQSGILPRFHEKYLNEPGLLKRYFNTSWKSRYADFDPLVESDITTLNMQLDTAIHMLFSQKT